MEKIKTPLLNMSAPKALLCGLALSLATLESANAQLTATGQIRTRTEFRKGQGTLQQKGDVPAFFTSQRTRLNVGYTGYRFKVFTGIQDVRVWGQDSSTINRNSATNDLMINEAWGEVILNDTVSSIENFSIKIGRQPIVYDDQKLLGGLDWLQQGRRHDAVVLKFSNKGWIADAGFAYNQNAEKATNNTYLGGTSSSAYKAGTNGMATMYQSMEYLYLGRKFFFGSASLLYFADNFSKASLTKPKERGTWTRSTYGAYVDATIKRKINVIASAYKQSGRDRTGVEVDASMFSVATQVQIGRKFWIGPGVDYLSGEDGTKTNTKNFRFDPLYGTPHKFWGYMDYFYVASPFGKQGLVNYFLKAKYNLKDNLILTADFHGFAAGNTVSDGAGGKRDSYLGTEIDLVLNYKMTKQIAFEAGYSVMMASDVMASAQVKNVANAEKTAQWAYLMVNITPNFLAK